MTPNTLFTVIQKLFGLYFLKEVVDIIPQLISGIFLLFDPGFTDDSFVLAQLSVLIIPVFILGFYFYLIYLLLFKTHALVHVLRLDKGFDQDQISINLSNSKLLIIALIIIAGIILLQEIPELTGRIFILIKEIRQAGGGTATTYSILISSAVKVVIALFLVGERKRITGFIEQWPTNLRTKANTLFNNFSSLFAACKTSFCL